MSKYIIILLSLLIFTTKEKDFLNQETTIMNEETLTGTQIPVIFPDDWGCGITKTIIEVDDTIDPDSVSPSLFKVRQTRFLFIKLTRTIIDAYVSDKEGNKQTHGTKYITIEMYISPEEGSPIMLVNNPKTWLRPFKIEITLKGELRSVTGTVYTNLSVESSLDVSKNHICKELDSFELKNDGFTDSYGNTISYALFKPEPSLRKQPLVVFHHGLESFGSDVVTNMLNFKVTTLQNPKFQDIFGGAYILVPQRKLMPQTKPYTIYELIQKIIEENPRIDTNRILTGGLSMGGEFTLKIAAEYNDLFAAIFPICPFRAGQLSDEEVEALKDVPIWFVHAENDETVPIIGTYYLIERLKEVGHRDIHTSFFEDVHDTSGRFFDEYGNPYQYEGHRAWHYFFNNECYDEDMNNMWEWLAEQTKE